MMKKNDPYKTTYHRDGTVTLWDVYTQSWLRIVAGEISDRTLATLNDQERARIASLRTVKVQAVTA
jgi:hypothetical protein